MARIVFFDLDGTLTTVPSPWQHIHEALGLWVDEGTRHLNEWLAGRIDYDTFFERDVAMWRGLPRPEVQGPLDTIPLRPEARPLLAALTEGGTATVILSSGFRYLASRLEEETGHRFGKIFANEMRFDIAGQLKDIERIVSGDPDHPRGKGSLLRAHCRDLGIDPKDALAVGDSASDIPMFRAAGTSLSLSDRDLGTTARVAPGALLRVLDFV